MDQIPVMTERKKKIDMHINVATKILGEIKRRAIDKLQDVEEEIMTSKVISTQVKNNFLEAIKREVKGQDEVDDKLRLLVIYVLCAADVSDIQEIIQVLKEMHKDQFDHEFVINLLKKRKDFEQLMG